MRQPSNEDTCVSCQNPIELGRPFARYVELAGPDAALTASLTSAPLSSAAFVYALPTAALLLPMDAGAKEAARSVVTLGAVFAATGRIGVAFVVAFRGFLAVHAHDELLTLGRVCEVDGARAYWLFLRGQHDYLSRLAY